MFVFGDFSLQWTLGVLNERVETLLESRTSKLLRQHPRLGPTVVLGTVGQGSIRMAPKQSCAFVTFVKREVGMAGSH